MVKVNIFFTILLVSLGTYFEAQALECYVCTNCAEVTEADIQTCSADIETTTWADITTTESVTVVGTLTTEATNEETTISPTDQTTDTITTEASITTTVSDTETTTPGGTTEVSTDTPEFITTFEFTTVSLDTSDITTESFTETATEYQLTTDAVTWPDSSITTNIEFITTEATEILFTTDSLTTNQESDPTSGTDANTFDSNDSFTITDLVTESYSSQNTIDPDVVTITESTNNFQPTNDEITTTEASELLFTTDNLTTNDESDPTSGTDANTFDSNDSFTTTDIVTESYSSQNTINPDVVTITESTNNFQPTNDGITTTEASVTQITFTPETVPTTGQTTATEINFPDLFTTVDNNSGTENIDPTTESFITQTATESYVSGQTNTWASIETTTDANTDTMEITTTAVTEGFDPDSTEIFTTPAATTNNGNLENTDSISTESSLLLSTINSEPDTTTDGFITTSSQFDIGDVTTQAYTSDGSFTITETNESLVNQTTNDFEITTDNPTSPNSFTTDSDMTNSGTETVFTTQSSMTNDWDGIIVEAVSQAQDETPPTVSESIGTTDALATDSDTGDVTGTVGRSVPILNDAGEIERSYSKGYPRFLSRSLKQAISDTESDLRCVVAVYEVGGTINVVRGCSTASNTTETRCNEAIGNDEATLSYCNLCEDDLCNSATKSAFAIAILLISVAINYLFA